MPITYLVVQFRNCNQTKYCLKSIKIQKGFFSLLFLLNTQEHWSITGIYEPITVHLPLFGQSRSRHSWRTGLLCVGSDKGSVLVPFRPPISCRSRRTRHSPQAFQLKNSPTRNAQTTYNRCPFHNPSTLHQSALVSVYICFGARLIGFRSCRRRILSEHNLNLHSAYDLGLLSA